MMPVQFMDNVNSTLMSHNEMFIKHIDIMNGTMDSVIHLQRRIGDLLEMISNLREVVSLQGKRIALLEEAKQ